MTRDLARRGGNACGAPAGGDRMKLFAAILILSLAPPAFAQGSRVRFTFSPESEQYAPAAKEYQDIWDAEGEKIVGAMEKVSGVKFAETDVRAIVFEGVSRSGLGDAPMRLRASYPPDVKKATIIHELGHRLIAGVPRTKELDEHRVLFLILYDVWVSLYGKDFADRMVEVEKGRRGLYDYESAWKWALSLTKEERAAKFKALRELPVGRGASSRTDPAPRNVKRPSAGATPARPPRVFPYLTENC